MKKMKYKTWLFAFLACTNVYANGNLDDSENFPPCSGISKKMTSERTLSGKEVFIPHAAQGVQVKFVSGEFYAEKNGASKLVQRANLSKELRGITSEQLDGFLKAGYVALKPLGEDDYSLDGKLRLRGGGPIVGAVAGVGTAAAIVATAITGNIPATLGLIYAAPAIITGAIALPTP